MNLKEPAGPTAQPAQAPPVPVKKVIRAGKAFVSAPRTFALELIRAPTRAEAPMTVSTHDGPVEADDRRGGCQAEIADGQAAR
jgi:hypothetical protein